MVQLLPGLSTAAHYLGGGLLCRWKIERRKALICGSQFGKLDQEKAALFALDLRKDLAGRVIFVRFHLLIALSDQGFLAKVA